MEDVKCIRCGKNIDIEDVFCTEKCREENATMNGKRYLTYTVGFFPDDKRITTFFIIAKSTDEAKQIISDKGAKTVDGPYICADYVDDNVFIDIENNDRVQVWPSHAKSFR